MVGEARFLLQSGWNRDRYAPSATRKV
jgi:hypothetical protein